VALVLLGLLWTLWLWPAPISDYELYWNEAGGTVPYERGGAGVALFALARYLFPQPQWAALAVNLPSAALLLWLFWRHDRTRWRAFALAGSACLLLTTPYLGVVQIDVVATALLGACWVLLLRPPAAWPRAASIGTAVLVGIMAVSTRPQFALTLAALAGLLLLAWLPARGRTRASSMIGLAGMLAAVAVAGFAIDQSARVAAGTGEHVRTKSGVTLYAGLLLADAGPACGMWTQRAEDAAFEERAKPLRDVIVERIAAQPPSHWLRIAQCKFVRQIALPGAFALYWASEPLREEAGAAPTAGQRRRLDAVEALYPWESRLQRVLVLAIYAAALVAFVYGWHRQRHAFALLPIAWLLSFWIVHLVFEVQGRYFLATILLLPLLSALVLRLREPEARTPDG